MFLNQVLGTPNFNSHPLEIGFTLPQEEELGLLAGALTLLRRRAKEGHCALDALTRTPPSYQGSLGTRTQHHRQTTTFLSTASYGVSR